MKHIYEALMYLTGWPLALLLIAGGFYFTFRCKFIQVRLFFESIRVVLEKPAIPGRISSFGALMVSTASRVGTGNIIGVSTALCLGGAGAVFWMWFFAIITGASAFVESTLAQIYKRRAADSSSYGGPAFYIESALKSRTLAMIITVCLIFTYGVGYNMLASYNLQSSFEVFSFYKPFYCWIFGGITSLLFLFAVLGGSRKLVRVTASLVPLMGLFYILLALTALCINFRNIPAMFELIFRSAFDFKAICGGFASSVLMYGLKRGLYSNEAGIGSAPNAAAAADVSHPVKQGLVQMLSVFIDTNLICTATALMCLSSGAKLTAKAAGAPYIQNALQVTFGMVGPVFIAVAMVLFAYTTLLGNFYYVESAISFFTGKKPPEKLILGVRILGAVLIFTGAGLQMDIAWGIADISQCLLAFINIPVCILIGSGAYKALKDYLAQRKAGVDPVYKAPGNGIKVKTDFWQ